MKLTKSILLMLLSVFPLIVQAQQIKGKLIDKTGEAISHATLIFQHVQDSLFICATISNQTGEFSVAQSVIPCRIIIQHLAFNTKIIIGNQYDLGSITLDEKSEHLNEVVVKASRPVM